MLMLFANDGGQPPRKSYGSGIGKLRLRSYDTRPTVSRDKESVRFVIHENRHLIRKCYEANTRESGKLVLDFTVSGAGSVEIHSVDSSDSEPRRVCLTAVLNGLKFPPLRSGQSLPVKYPFIFCGKGP